MEWCAVSVSCSNFPRQLNRHLGAAATWSWFSSSEKHWKTLTIHLVQQGNYCQDISTYLDSILEIDDLWWSQAPRLLVSVSRLWLSRMWNTWVWNPRNVWKCLQSGAEVWWTAYQDTRQRSRQVFWGGLWGICWRRSCLSPSRQKFRVWGLVKLQLSKSCDTRPTNRICRSCKRTITNM